MENDVSISREGVWSDLPAEEALQRELENLEAERLDHMGGNSRRNSGYPDWGVVEILWVKKSDGFSKVGRERGETFEQVSV